MQGGRRTEDATAHHDRVSHRPATFGRTTGAPATPGSIAFTAQPHSDASTSTSSSIAGEGEVGRRHHVLPGPVVDDHVQAAAGVEPVDAVGLVAADPDAALGVDRQPVGNGAGQLDHRLQLTPGQRHPHHARHLRFDQVEVVAADRAAVGEPQGRHVHPLGGAVRGDPHQAAGDLVPRARVGHPQVSRRDRTRDSSDTRPARRGARTSPSGEIRMHVAAVRVARIQVAVGVQRPCPAGSRRARWRPYRRRRRRARTGRAAPPPRLRRRAPRRATSRRPRDDRARPRSCEARGR